eukprot:Em0019g949a
MWRLLRRKRAFFTVEPVCLVYMLASFFSYSVFQELMRSMVCRLTPDCITTGANSTQTTTTGCNVTSAVDQSVEAQSSHWLLYFNIAYGVPSILVSLLYGGVSDQIGRKPFIVLPIVGNIVNTIVMISVVYSNTSHVHYFLIGGFAGGLLGNFSIFNLAAYSYVADISTHSKRTLHISILESMTYLGATLSGLIGSFWLGSGGFGPPLAFIVGLDLLALAYVIIALPGTLIRSHELHCSSLVSGAATNVVEIVKVALNSWRMIFLLLIFFVVELNFLGITDTVILYTLGEPLCWSYSLVGYFLAASVFLNGVVSLFVLPFLTWIKFQDTSIVLFGLIAGAGSLLIMSFASKNWLMFIAPVVGALRGGVIPCVRSMLSKLTPAKEQGVLFSGIGVVESICSLCASALYNSLFPLAQRVTPGFCFSIMAGTLLIPSLLTLILHCHWKVSSHSDISRSRSSDEIEPLLNHHD